MSERGAGGVLGLGASTSAERADAFNAWFGAYAARRLDLRLADERRSLPPHLVLDLGNAGALGLQSPGGLDLDARDMARVLARVATVDVTVALLLGIHNGLGLRTIQRYAQPALAETLVPRLATGRELAAFALTEPGAGSNPRPWQPRPAGWRAAGS